MDDLVYIKAAAVKNTVGRIFTGKDHYEIVMRMRDLGESPTREGFVTNNDVFVGRSEAKDIARRAKQLIYDNKNPALVSDEIGGKWYWDSTIGEYVKTSIFALPNTSGNLVGHCKIRSRLMLKSESDTWYYADGIFACRHHKGVKEWMKRMRKKYLIGFAKPRGEIVCQVIHETSR